jgi:hypothetical protein
VRTALLLAGLSATAAGCAFPQSPLPVPSYTVVHDTRDPAQYRSALPRDVQTPPKQWAEARGESCRTMLSFPPNPPTPFLGSETAAALIPWPSVDATFGNDGYARAVAKALQDFDEGSTLVDVRTDLHTTAILGIWRRECIEVRGIVPR